MNEKINYIYFTLIIISNAFSQEINLELQEELNSILHKDQTLRELFDKNISIERKNEILKDFSINKKDFSKEGWLIVRHQDSLNLVAIERIIETHGYPGKSMVGEPTNNTAWYVIQHSNKIEEYFSLIEQAGKSGEIKMTKVAMMQDRMLMDKGEEQIYGTQGSGRHIKNIETGKEEMFWFIWPIKNPKNVNTLRKIVGFSTTVEENAKNMDIEYMVYSIKEINTFTQN